MKRTLTILSFMLLTCAAYAQSTTVKGFVLDSLTRQGEPAAVISFFRSGEADRPAAFTVTAEDGSFEKAVPGKGNYELHFSNMGRKPRTVLFELNGQEVLDLGEILIEDDVQTLKAGTVTAQKTLVKMEVDKITYKVEDDVDSKTSTVLDMLRKVPMVSVDGQDNITVNGSSSFQVYVDGKPNQMISSNPGQILKMMPASVI
ncbi:MAG: carboxypeptidase-like regulatory domain-containing protein, partial [Bacteroidales bacterium]|nr:carboxypeptidase-like regulatory domain-containing protein [Bacteroidales bacterium]